MEFWRDTARYELTTPDRRSPRLCCVDAALLLEGPGLSRLGDDVCHLHGPPLFRGILDAPQGRASEITPGKARRFKWDYALARIPEARGMARRLALS